MNDEKEIFSKKLKSFAASLSNKIVQNNQWTMRGFIDVYGNVYPFTTDPRTLSKILVIHLLPELMIFAGQSGYTLEPLEKANSYPDFTFRSNKNPDITFAVSWKMAYRDRKHPGLCSGFTLGSHGEYFVNRESTKNIQYPYGSYSGHFCIGMIYSRVDPGTRGQVYSIKELDKIPAVIKDIIFFSAEKWQIASDKTGTGNISNIGSIRGIDDILNGNGVFAKAGEELFDDYWTNFGKIEVIGKTGRLKKLSSFSEYLRYRGLPETLDNPKNYPKFFPCNA